MQQVIIFHHGKNTLDNAFCTQIKIPLVCHFTLNSSSKSVVHLQLDVQDSMSKIVVDEERYGINCPDWKKSKRA